MIKLIDLVNEVSVGVNVHYFYKKANKNKNKFFKMLSDFRKKHSDTKWIKMLNYALEDFNENPKKYKTIDDKQNILFKNLQNNKKVNEAYKHPLYGSDTEYWEVMKPYDLYIAAGGKEPTGQWSTAGPGGNKMIYRDKATKVRVDRGMQIGNLPGGVFLIDGGKKKAYRIITKKGGTGTEKHLRKISSNYSYSIWKNWL